MAKQKFDTLLDAMLTRPPLDAGKPAKAAQASGEDASEGSAGTRTPKGKSATKSEKR